MRAENSSENKTQPEEISTELRKRRLLYRATHRGTYENDLLLGGFAKKMLPAMNEEELTSFEALLDFQDPDLADWLTQRKEPPPSADKELIRYICRVMEKKKEAV